MIEDEAFQKIRNLAAGSNSQFKEINIKSTKLKITELAYNIKQKIISEIRNKLISLKLDSATCMERRFLGINIQYIMNSKIIVRNLAVIEVYESQTGDYLKDCLLDVLIEFNILKEQIYSVTTDNGSNMIKITKLLGGSYYTENHDKDSDSDDLEESSGEEDNIEQMTDLAAHVATNIMINDGSNAQFTIRGMLCAAHTLN